MEVLGCGQPGEGCAGALLQRHGQGWSSSEAPCKTREEESECFGTHLYHIGSSQLPSVLICSLGLSLLQCSVWMWVRMGHHETAAARFMASARGGLPAGLGAEPGPPASASQAEANVLECGCCPCFPNFLVIPCFIKMNSFVLCLCLAVHCMHACRYQFLKNTRGKQLTAAIKKCVCTSAFHPE